MDIKHRSFDFSLDIVQLCQNLPAQTGVSAELALSLLRAGTALAIQVEEAHGSPKSDFISHMQTAAAAAREAHYWLRLLRASDLASEAEIDPLQDEAQQLAAILSSIVKTAKRNDDKG